MIDHRKRQLDKARRESRELIAEHVTFEQAQTNAKAKHYPNGSYFAWARDEVWGPINSAQEKNNAARMPMDQERNIDRSPPIARDDSERDVQGDWHQSEYADYRYSDHQAQSRA